MHEVAHGVALVSCGLPPCFYSGNREDLPCSILYFFWSLISQVGPFTIFYDLGQLRVLRSVSCGLGDLRLCSFIKQRRLRAGFRHLLTIRVDSCEKSEHVCWGGIHLEAAGLRSQHSALITQVQKHLWRWGMWSYFMVKNHNYKVIKQGCVRQFSTKYHYSFEHQTTRLQ